MKKIFLLLFLLNTLILKAQVILPPAAGDSIIKNASVIKQDENIFFEVTDIDRAYLTIHKVFTVMSEAGKDALLFQQYGNRFISLSDAVIKVYDALGKQTGKYSEKDMFTTAIGGDLVSEGKVTYFEIPAAAYPVTVDLSYEVKFKGTLIYPSFPIQTAGVAVKRFLFTAKVPAELDLRYKTKNILLKPEITEQDKYKIYKWSVNNLPSLVYEEGTAGYKYPQVLLAPNKFNIYDTKGDMTTWKNFGMWEYSLLGDLYDLPEERKLFFQKLTANAKDEKEKIKTVYSFLQKNLRYVSIQLGIGGFKPFSASFTDKKKYGDCKGLSFYTHAILKSLGIKSYVALINAGYDEEPVDPLFPVNDFNHMILCVPNPKDTLWLECTSRTNEFGVLGSFTENRNALLITESGGELVATPVSKSADNIFSSNTSVNLDEDLSGKAVVNIDLKGEYREDFDAAVTEKKDEQKKFITNETGFKKQPDDFILSKKETENNYTGSIELLIEKIPEFTAGSKVFLNKHLFKIIRGSLPKAEKRRLDFHFKHPFEKSDTIAYKLPANYIIDVLPQPKKISCDYAGYITNYWFSESEHTLYSTFKLVLLKSKIPAAAYASVKSFFDEVIKDDAQLIVVKKN